MYLKRGPLSLRNAWIDCSEASPLVAGPLKRGVFKPLSRNCFAKRVDDTLHDSKSAGSGAAWAWLVFNSSFGSGAAGRCARRAVSGVELVGKLGAESPCGI
jgi:hypothetical protein